MTKLGDYYTSKVESSTVDDNLVRPEQAVSKSNKPSVNTVFTTSVPEMWQQDLSPKEPIGDLFEPYGGVKRIDKRAVTSLDDLYDIPEARALEQTKGEKLLQFIPRVAVKAATEAVRFPGTVGGLAEWASTGFDLEEFSSSIDNAWMRALDDSQKFMNEEVFPVYVRKEVEEGNLLRKIVSPDWWATTGADGVGFLVGMMGPGLATRALGAGTAMSKFALKSLKLGAKYSTKFGQYGDDILAASVNTINEAAIEGIEAAKGAEEKLFNETLNKLLVQGYDPGEASKMAEEYIKTPEAKKLIGEAGANTTLANMAILIGPNMLDQAWLFSKVGKKGGKMVKALETSLQGGEAAAKSTTKELVKSALGKIVVGGSKEGFWEEGMQYASGNYFQDRAAGLNNKNVVSGILGEYFEGLKEVEMQESIFLGGVLGGGMGAYGGIRSKINEDKILHGDGKTKGLLELFNNNFVKRYETIGDITNEDGTIDFSKAGRWASDIINNETNKELLAVYESLGASEKLDFAKQIHDFNYMLPFFKVDGGKELLIKHINDLAEKDSKYLKETLGIDSNTATEIQTELLKKADTFEEIYYRNKLDYKAPKVDKALGTEQQYEEFSNFLEDTKLSNLIHQEFAVEKISKLNNKISTLESKDNLRTDEQNELKESKSKLEENNMLLEALGNEYNSLNKTAEVEKTWRDYINSEDNRKKSVEKEVKKAAKQDIENAVNNVTADNIEEVEKTVNDSDILNDTEKEVYRNKLSAVKNKLKVQSEINPETTTDWNNLISNAVNEKELDAIVDQMTKAGVPVDFSAVNIKRQQLVPSTPPKVTEEGVSSGITDINMFKSKPVETAKKILETNEADPQNEEEYTKQERESNDKDDKFLVPVAKEVSIAYRSKVGDEVPVAGGGKRIKDAFNEEGKVILEEGFNHKLLEQDYATANTEIFLSIDTAHEDYNSTKNDINNVPIVIKNSEGEVLGYVHQLNWFDKQTLSEELMVKLKDETLAIRKQLTSPNVVVKSKVKYKAPGWLNQNFNKPLTLAEAFKKDNQYDDRVAFRILNKSQKLSFQGNIANPSLTNNLKLVGVPVQLIPSANGTFIAKRMKQVKLSDSNFADEVMHNVVGILLHVAKNKNVSQKVLTEEVNKYLYSTSFGKELADNFTSGLFKNNKLLFNLDLFTAGERSIVVSITSPRNMNRFIRYKVKDNNIIEEIDIKGNIVSQITPLQFETILKQSLGEKYINLTEQGFLNPQKFSRKVADENYKLTDKVEDYRDYLSENNIVNTFVHGVTTKEGTITYVTQPTIEIDTNVTTEDLSMTEGTIDPKPEVPVEKSDIEAKKADIEKRRQEELSNIAENADSKGNTKSLSEFNDGDYIVNTDNGKEYELINKSGTKVKLKPAKTNFQEIHDSNSGGFILKPTNTTKEQIDKINAKYDAELAEIEQALQPTLIKQIKPEVSEIFDSNPELANIGTPEQYSQYLDTIFPDSKVKDIVYHGTTEFEGEVFKKDKLASLTGAEDAKVGFHFSDSKTATAFGIPSKLKTGKDIFTIPVLLNMTNPEYMNNMGELRGIINNPINPSEKVQELVKKGKDSINIASYQGGVDNIVFEPEQIHILGSKQDIEGFKEFVGKNKQITPTRTNKLLGAINTATIETLEDEQVEDIADLLPINIDYSTTSVMSFSKLPNVVQENDVVSSLTNFYIQNLNENKGDEQLAYQQLLDDLKGVKEQAEANLLGGTKTANKQIAKLMNTVLDNFEEVKDDNGVTVFTGYKNRIELELNKLKFDYREEEYDGENSKESFDNDKNFKTDPEKSASARIKRVLNFIPLYEKGVQKFNVLGLPIYRDYYSTFNTIMEATADVPINEILSELDILAKENKYPETNVYRQVLNIINNDNDTLKNDFAKVFRKQRALLVKVLMYPNDKGLPNNNPYISNRSGSSGMLLDQWKESFKNKLIEDKKGNLRYDIAANKKLSTRFNNLKPSGNIAQYLTELSAIFTEAGLPVSVEALEKLHGTYLRKPSRLTLIDVRKVGANYDNAGFDQTIKVNFQYFFEEITKPFVLNDADGLKNDVFKNQANKISLLAKYENIVNPTNLSHSFKNGHGDTVYGFVNPHYLSSLISQIKGGDTSLYSDSFSSKSTWVNNADNINALQIEYIDSAVNGNNTSMDAVEFEDMSSLEREQVKTAFTLGKKAVTKGDVTVRYLTPTPSDKTTFPLITALKQQVTLNDLTTDMRIDSNSKLADTLYDLMVQSELGRINETLVLFNNAKKTNDWTDLIPGEHYAKINETVVPGSRAYFFLIPQLNETLNPFLEKQEPFNLSKEWVDITKNALINRINELIDRKSDYWQEIGMFKRLDNSYMKEVYPLLSQQQIEEGLANQYAVTDYVVNSMMGYANSIMLLVGDPATFTKPEKSWDGTINTWQSMVDGTITNMFKRTAKDIAPGYEGLFEATEKNYNVLFIEEPKKNSPLIEDYKGVLSKQISKLTKIELADAQEWTTLKEHLRVMRATGIISTAQEKIMLENAQTGTLTDAQIGVILQPMKPVQVGRMNYGKNGKQFFVNYYIKTSSFPLIPQLTQGLEIDALRKYMEESSIDRLVPNTAIKNGFFNSVTIYENGKLLLDENNNIAPKGVNADGIANNIHILDRSFFRVQQDIPYDPNKSKILEGSQLKKLKFSDLFEAYDFVLNGESKKGYELKEMDDAIHIEIYKRQYESLMNKLKATQDKKGKYVLTDVAELKKLLVEEADARGFDYNDIMILDTLLSKNSFDNLPLFVHPALPKLEALLNSLISNNVLKTKFPGKSFVQGSSMGFDFEIEGTKDIIERVLNKTGVVLTNEFTGELSYKVKQNSKGEDYVEAQVMMPWYFKESIAPFINKVTGILDTSRIDPKLLEAVGYRIPTQDHGSMVKLKVVGFLPKSSGDLIIVPPEMSKLMGSDFDVDKLYIHWYNYITENGRLNYITPNYESIEESTTEQLQNLSLEITHSILENTEIAKRVLTPLDNNDVKDVLKNIGEIKTSEEIDESKASQSALVYDGLHSAFVDINAAGQYGIGVGSVASTSHVLSQYAGLYLRKYKVKKRTINESILFTDKKGELPFTDNNTGKQVKQDGVKTHSYPNAASEGLFRLDRIFGITGKRISQVIKNIQTESVDNAKNQRLFGMNLNKHTFGVGLFLAKTGLDENYIGNFLNQPILIDYVKELNKLSDIGSGDFINIKQQKEEIQKQLAAKYGAAALEVKPKLISLEEMQENLSKTDQKFQVTVLESFISYDNIGSSLASLFRSINTDTKYLDKNITSSVKRLDDFNGQFYPVNPDSQRIGNIDNLKSTLQFKAVEYGLQNSLDLFDRLFPYKSNFFQTVVESFKVNNKLEELTENQLESLSKGLKNAMWVDAVINTYSLDELAERQKLLFGESSLGNRVNNAKEKIDNLLIKLLVVNTDAKGAHTIEFPTAGTLEKDFNLKMQQSWLSLYKTHKRIAVDLVKYVLLNGNERNARDFSRFIPIDILKMEGIIDNITNSYNEILSNTDKVDTYLKQYFQHNPSKSFKGDIKDFTFYDENGKKVSEYYKAAYLRPKDETSNIKYADVDFINIYLEGSKLLKRSNQGYVKIPTLGNSKKMITEYNISNEEKQSIFDVTVETVQPLATNTTKIPEQVVSNANDGAAVLNKFGFTPGNTVLDVLNYIIKRGSNSGQIELAKVLLEKAGRVNDINFIRDFPKDEKGNLRSVFGTMQGKNMYIPPVNMINIPKNNKWNFKEMSADELFGMVFLHELIHAFTANELRNNDKGIFATTMLKHYREYVNSPQKSGRFKNAEKSTVEFVAELFTNAEFQKELNSIKSGKTNLLAEIWETIVNFIAGNINKDSLLAAALNDALNLMDTVGEVKQPSFQESINNALETTEDIAKLLSFDSQQKEVSLSERKDMTNISTFTNYSGAALGGDTVWANIGKEFGLGKQVNYRPEDLQKLTKEQLLEVENAYQQAVKDLGRKPLAANTFAGGLVRRDYLQAKAADAVFAVSTIVEPGQKDPKGYVNKTNKSIVSGGTGYAVQMAINLGKPVYVFDQNKEEWYSYETGLQDPITGATFNDFIKWDTPTLTTKFAGIGTREINDAGKQAIREVYEKTTQQKELSLSKTKQDIINNLELYSQKIGDVTVSDIQNMNTEQIGELLKKICK